MPRLAEQARSTMKLIDRSPDIGEGWRSVSECLRPNMIAWLKTAEELYEFDGKRIRLNHDGLTILKYLL